MGLPILICAAVVVLALLAGCGQKGPLYFPKDKPSAAVSPSPQN